MPPPTEPVRLDKPAGPPDSSPGSSPWGAPASPYGAPGTTPYTTAGPYGGPQPYAGPQPYVGFVNPPDHPQATTSLILGGVGLFLGFSMGIGFFLSPFAWAIGRRAVREIDASQGRYGGRSQADAGRVMGIVGTVLLVLGIAALVILVASFVVVASGSTSP